MFPPLAMENSKEPWMGDRNILLFGRGPPLMNAVSGAFSLFFRPAGAPCCAFQTGGSQKTLPCNYGSFASPWLVHLLYGTSQLGERTNG
jgi:hypothetical protein